MSGCEIWKEAFQKNAMGEGDPTLAAGVLQAHEQTCPSCGREAQAWRGWQAQAPAAVEDADIRRAAQRFLASPALAQLHQRPSRSGAWWVATALAAAAAVAFVMFARSNVPTGSSVTLTAVEPPRLVMASVDAGGEQEVLRAGARLELGATLSARLGRLCFTMDPGVLVCLAPGAQARIVDTGAQSREVHLVTGLAMAWLRPQPKGTSFAIHTDDGTVRAVGTHFAVEAGTQDQSASVRLFHGEVVLLDRQGRSGGLKDKGALALANLSPLAADVKKPPELGSMQELGGLLAAEAAIESPARLDVLLSSDAGTLFVNDRAFGRGPLSLLLPPGHHRLRVEGGGHILRDEVTLGPEDAVVRSYELPVALAPPPQEERPHNIASAEAKLGRAAPMNTPTGRLLLQARRLRADGSFKAAAQVYQRLHRLHPKTPEGRLALVLLGDVQLSHLHQPAAALRSFDAYVRSGDDRLGPEAAYGRIKALASLGRGGARARAEADLLRRYPDSLQAGALRGPALEP